MSDNTSSKYLQEKGRQTLQIEPAGAFEDKYLFSKTNDDERVHVEAEPGNCFPVR